LTALFLIMTVLTSVTGFFFPYKGATPGIKIGILSLVVLLLAMIARGMGDSSRGGWRGTWVITAVVAQFFNFLVLVVQSFEKVPASARAGADAERRCRSKVAQLLTLVLFIVLGDCGVQEVSSGSRLIRVAADLAQKISPAESEQR
jgi:hypothetical protein